MRTIQNATNDEPMVLDFQFELGMLNMKLNKVLIGLKKSILSAHCFLPAFVAVLYSVFLSELLPPQLQSWRRWVCHHLGHLELEGMFLEDIDYQAIAIFMEMPDILTTGLFPVESPLQQESRRIRELRERLSKSKIFDNFICTVLLYFFL